MTGWECPRCGETRTITTGCRCAGAGRCVWCGHYPDGWPPCECTDADEPEEEVEDDEEGEE